MVCLVGVNGWIWLNLGYVMGSIFDVVFSFIVYELSGIIEWLSVRFLFDRLCR